ncbi:hypothetical protein BpHYR1_027740 [Brachionus plicatilis]|uniref:Uncharacterized protein n=1 Tax=Brachionus plicatilis TaxID=10195 RepID=A0A3M7P560_BRAPC|nr:hypothetical protein BpHYR1_027740 [Brachionus plicatilis]
MNRHLANRIILDYPDSITGLDEDISHCNFTAMRQKCNLKSHFKQKIDLETIEELIVFGDFVILIILNPILGFIGIFLNISTAFMFKNQYNIFSLEQHLPNTFLTQFGQRMSIFQWSILFKNPILKFLINIMVLGFTYSRLCIVQNSMFKLTEKRLNFAKFFMVTLVIGIFLNFLNYFFAILNYDSPSLNFPYSLLQDDLSIKFKLDIILKSIYAINEILNEVIDVKENKNIELRNLRATLINSIVNFFLRVFELFPMAYSFLHFYSLQNKNEVSNRFEFFMFVICYKYRFDQFMRHLCNIRHGDEKSLPQQSRILKATQKAELIQIIMINEEKEKLNY